MILLALIGCLIISKYIAGSKIVYSIKWFLAKYKIRYIKENKHLPIGAQLRTLKPLDCKDCLAFWTSLSLLLFENYNFFLSFTIAITFYTLSKKYNNDKK